MATPPIHIFDDAFWTDENGNHPEPFTIIFPEDVKSGRWIPKDEQAWKLFTLYCKQIDKEENRSRIKKWLICGTLILAWCAGMYYGVARLVGILFPTHWYSNIF